MRQEISTKALDEMRTASLDEAAELLRQIAGQRRADESLKAVFQRLGRKLTDWSDNRIRDVWHRNDRVRVRAEEIEQLRAIAPAPADSEQSGNELLEQLHDRVARLESIIRRLESTDEAFHSEDLAALRHQRQQMG